MAEELNDLPAHDANVDAALKAKLAELDRAIDRQTAAQESKSFPGQRNLDASAVRASRIGIELMVALLAAGALGYGLDKAFGTMPLFMLLGALIGFGAGMLNAWRALNGKYGQVGFRPETKED